MLQTTFGVIIAQKFQIFKNSTEPRVIACQEPEHDFCSKAKLDPWSEHIEFVYDQLLSLRTNSSVDPTEINSLLAVTLQGTVVENNAVLLARLLEKGEPLGFDWTYAVVDTAATRGSLTCIKFLVEHNHYKIDRRDAALGPLGAATIKGHKDVVAFLFEQGARLSEGNWDKGIELALRVLKARHADIAWLFFQHIQPNLLPQSESPAYEKLRDSMEKLGLICSQ